MPNDQAISAFANLVFPYATERFAVVKAHNLKMAHYTTAENGALILKNRSLWLRNAALMNDFSEVAYGSGLLQQSLAAGLGQRLEAALDAAYPGLFKAVAERLVRMDWQTRNQTYLTSMSAHSADDRLGRLSMWRAYGGPTSGVAIVFNTEVFEHESVRLGAYTSPVLYGGLAEFTNELDRVIRNIEHNAALLREVPVENAEAIVFNALHFSTLSTKHPAFEEEQEWRVIHSPLTEASAFIPTSVQTVRGIPQMICEVPLRDQPGLDMAWLELDRLLHRIIIGPCVYPNQVGWAFREILRDLGIPDPDSRIALAPIPLRQQH
jgi:hypothetical protein